MTMRHWLLLIGVMTAVGLLKVAQQTSVTMQAYDLGRQRATAHALQSEAWWLETDVIGLESPAHLAQAMKQSGRTEVVAWSILPAAAPNRSRLIRLSQLMGWDD